MILEKETVYEVAWKHIESRKQLFPHICDYYDRVSVTKFNKHIREFAEKGYIHYLIESR